MNGFESLQKVKDDMMRPMYEKRRHLGCQLCGNTFHGHYQKTGYQSDKVPTHDDVFYPDCPTCGVAFTVRPANEAVSIYEHEQEKKFNYVDQGTSRSGKTHYTRQWFDITNTDTGETWEAKR